MSRSVELRQVISYVVKSLAEEARIHKLFELCDDALCHRSLVSASADLDELNTNPGVLYVVVAFWKSAPNGG